MFESRSKKIPLWRISGPLFLLIAGLCLPAGLRAQATDCLGWSGTTLIDGESLSGWDIEEDTGSSGHLSSIPGTIGQGVQLDWDIGTGNWVQARYDFPAPVDLSQADLFGLNLHGGSTAELANTVRIMFADAADVFYGYDMTGQVDGINQIARWLDNLSIPKAVLYHLFTLGDGEDTDIDWSRITRFFITVQRPSPTPGGGMGSLGIDQVKYDIAANWLRQTQFEETEANPDAVSAALSYILGAQRSTGLLISWKEEETENPPARAWLYDQALALIALTRAGTWQDGIPLDDAAQAATRLVDFIAGAQKEDGHWARVWDPNTGDELDDDSWVGDQSWAVMALARYAVASGDEDAMASADAGAAWIADRIDASGKVSASTEGTVDAWWAMIATSRFDEANLIKAYLLSDETVWDAQLRYWWRGFEDPVIAMDTATWVSAFARNPVVNLPQRGMDALSLVCKTLSTVSDDGSLEGLDGMGPVSLWNEGTAQYVTAGGKDAQHFLDDLISQQRADGSMPGSPDNWRSDSFGWLSDWSGLAATTWLYFAVTETPFPASWYFEEDYETRMQLAYMAYYSRPADPEGLMYWADRLDSQGGALTNLIAAFGTSDEYTERFSGLSDEELVNALYVNLFNRDAEDGGLRWYIDNRLIPYREECTASQGGDPEGCTEYALSRISLDVLNGATGEDTLVIQHKLQVARYFTDQVSTLGLCYGEDDIETVSAILQDVGLDSSSVTEAKERIDALEPCVEAWLTSGDAEVRLEKQNAIRFRDVPESALTVRVDETTRYQQMDGFGAALTDSSAWLIHNQSADRRARLLSELFSSRKGSGIDVIRVPIGGTDFIKDQVPYTYNDIPCEEVDWDLEHFSIAHDEDYIIPVIKDALRVNPDLAIMASPWTAPAWMKDGCSLNGGQLKEEPGYTEVYSDYLTRFIQAYAERGISVRAMTLQNEPQSGNPQLPTMVMDWWDQVNLLVYDLLDDFTRAEIDTEIIVYDHNWDDPGYAVDVLDDLANNHPDAYQTVTGVAFHCYAGDPSGQDVVYQAHPDKAIYFTECTGSYQHSLGQQPDENFAGDLVWEIETLAIDAVRNWAKTVILWNLALNQDGGPHLPTACSEGDGRRCRGLVTIDDETGTLTYLT